MFLTKNIFLYIARYYCLLLETRNCFFFFRIFIFFANNKVGGAREEANVLFLNFNEYLLDENKEISKEILNTIAYSVFDNYDVNVVYFETNSKKIDFITKK